MDNKMAIMANILIVLLEIRGFILSYRHVKWQVIIYYTEISNFLAFLASIFYILTNGNDPLWRYFSCCLLMMTFLISLFVLSPALGGVKTVMLGGECLYHHTLVPLISLFSYLFFEKHSDLWLIPVVFSMIYGLLMIYLNHLGKLSGPYDFFKIRENGLKATIIWVIVLIIIISAISLGIMFIAG